MHISEMDIEFQEQLFNAASNSYAGLQTEERMLYLNRAQNEFIRNVIDPKKDPLVYGYAGTRYRLDEIETLITTKQAPLFVLDSLSAYTPLPSNYFHGLEINAKTDCDTTKGTNPAANFQYAVVPLPTVQITTNWVLSITVNDGVSTLELPVFALATHMAVNFDASLNYQIIPLLIRKNATMELSIYWERFGSIYSSNSFILVWENPSVILSDAKTVINGGAPTTYAATAVTRSGIATTKATSLVPCRTVDASVVRQQTNPFTRSRFRSPLVSITTGNVVLYHFGKFVATELELKYLRKPLELSLTLNQSCELGSTPGTKASICQNIIRIAVRSVLGDVLSPGYQVANNEVLHSS